MEKKWPLMNGILGIKRNESMAIPHLNGYKKLIAGEAGDSLRIAEEIKEI